eukprot:CAMPEP_0114653266 /NCGR_PEP_ID=MMETSP0191-20121206/9636_1 /TAXON_ID=126664 /ORGANISM="Sorites sp." /LENGTH=218 /DNA_ID=CAMNT_0001868237 /DNA_START=46 /DNA_END=702 /DNA_ORIENTATION=+
MADIHSHHGHRHWRGAVKGHKAHIQPKYRKVVKQSPEEPAATLELADEAFGGVKVEIGERQLSWVDGNGSRRPLEADDAQHYLQGIFRHLLKDSAVVMVPEASLGPLSLQDEATEHLTYRLMKTPCNRIEWDVDLMDSQHLCVTEIEELALGSDIIWSMRRQGHELDEEEAAKLMNTVRLLLPVASKVSHDPEDEYLTELFQEDACYFEEHGCYPPDF